MIIKILIALAAAFGLFWTFKTKKLFPAIITLGLIAGIIMVLIRFISIQTPGLYVYMFFTAVAFLYGIIIKEKNIRERITICLMSAFIFAYWLWVLNHWHGNTILAPVIVLLAAVFGILSKAKLKNELGFLVILAVDAIAIIIEYWMSAN